MEFLSLTHLLWRRRWWTVPAAALAGGLVILAALSSPPTYRASGSLVLLNPAARPENPVTHISPPIENPYVRIGDLSVVVDILKRIMQSAPVNAALQEKGFRGTYEVAANIDFYNGPIIDVAAESDSPDVAITNVKLVMAEAEVQLALLQDGEAVESAQQIRTEVVVPPTEATTVLSGTLRRVVAAGGLGGAMVISAAVVGEGLGKKRQRRTEGPTTTATAAPPTAQRAVTSAVASAELVAPDGRTLAAIGQPAPQLGPLRANAPDHTGSGLNGQSAGIAASNEETVQVPQLSVEPGHTGPTAPTKASRVSVPAVLAERFPLSRAGRTPSIARNGRNGRNGAEPDGATTAGAAAPIPTEGPALTEAAPPPFGPHSSPPNGHAPAAAHASADNGTHAPKHWTWEPR